MKIKKSEACIYLYHLGCHFVNPAEPDFIHLDHTWNLWISDGILFRLADVIFEPVVYPEMFAMGMGAYILVAILQFRRIRKIPMDIALKNVE